MTSGVYTECADSQKVLAVAVALTILQACIAAVCLLYYFCAVIRNLQQKNFHLIMLALMGLYPIFLLMTAVYFQNACQAVSPSQAQEQAIWR